MSTHPTNNINNYPDDYPECNVQLSIDSIQSNVNNVLCFTENPNINNNTIQQAHAVEGINGYLLDQPMLSTEEIIHTSTGINDYTPNLFTATLVAEESLHKLIPVVTTLPGLSAVPMEDPQKSCQQWCYTLMAVATLFAGIGGAIVAVISSQQKNKSIESNFTNYSFTVPLIDPISSTNLHTIPPAKQCDGGTLHYCCS